MERKDFEDDGRTIADMSGTIKTPWYLSFSALNRRKPKTEAVSYQPVEMTKEESRRFMLSAVLAGLTVGLVFIGAFFLFILFAVYVWF